MRCVNTSHQCRSLPFWQRIPAATYCCDWRWHLCARNRVWSGSILSLRIAGTVAQGRTLDPDPKGSGLRGTWNEALPIKASNQEGTGRQQVRRTSTSRIGSACVAAPLVGTVVGGGRGGAAAAGGGGFGGQWLRDCRQTQPPATAARTAGAAPTHAPLSGGDDARGLSRNAATIASIRRRPARQPSAVYALILHLSAADLLVTVFCIAGEAAWSYAVQWLAGNAACKLFKFAQVFSLYLSTFILVLIGIDRFVAVRYPMRALGTAKRLSRLIAFVWVLSMLLSIPQMVIFHVERGPFCELFLQCVTYGFYTEPWQEQLYAAFSLMCMFVLPLAILIGTYVSTVITIARSERAFRAEVAVGLKSEVLDANRRRLIHRAKTKSMRISVVIVVAFIVWWTPYYCMMIIFLFLNPDKHLSEDLQSAIFFFGMSNSLVNPIIYGAFHLWRPKRRGRLSDRGRDGSTFTQRSLMGSMRRVRPPTAEETTLVALEEGPAAAPAAAALQDGALTPPPRPLL
ncbi:gonadotropin-releasing hormone receptor-like [Schistocerca cancellata]|uniref:gonadotropin-releasing hormone receptor-like n=1 Tax=Schistocerca cancellata TaxID=274614 RepID=UPI002117C28F|nr:gonadotropin-releasing hormone receptor-like [Schistocerca cancellata]